MDFFVANLLIPTGGLLLALFAGWALTRESMADELGWQNSPVLLTTLRFLIKFVALIAIIGIFLVNIFGTSVA